MIEIVTQPVLRDNFCYVLVDRADRRAVVIDPGEAAPVARWLAREGLALERVLLTHHHADHVGGAADLKAATGCAVTCSAADLARVPAATDGVADGARFTVLGTSVEVIATPGHTRGQVAYWLARERALFTGDTLFSAGCGRLFEGTADEMLHSLRHLDARPAETRVYFGHEYTLRNLDFVASHLHLARDPRGLGAEVERYRVACAAQLAAGRPTTPSTLATERQVNPFLTARDVDEFARWRQARDQF